MGFTKKLLFLLGVLTVCGALLALNDGVKFTGNEDHSITLNEASQLTSNFQMQATSESVIGGFFGREAVEKILNQDGCVGLRYYYGLQDDGTPVLVLVGVDEFGHDMTDGELAERSFLCPPFCDDENQLNASATKGNMPVNF